MQGVTGGRRWNRNNRCPICGGCDSDERGKEKRCHGFMSGDGKYIHCSRAELAGEIRMSPKSETYAHRRDGRCRCGTMHNEPAEPPRREGKVHEQGAVELGPIVAEYLYRDERRNVLFRVTRHEPKTFRQWRPGGRNGWTMGIGGIRRVLYRLPELLAADPGEPVYIGEGEKDVDALRALGLVATCNPQGAGKWSAVADCARAALRGRRVTIIADKDDAGRRHAADVAAQLADVVVEVKTIESPVGKDAADWVAAGATDRDIEAAAAGPSPPPDSEPSFEAEFSKALAEIARRLSADRQVVRKPLFVEVGDLFRREYPQTPWQVKGLITRGGTAVLGAEPKSCKTWLATEIAVAIC